MFNTQTNNNTAFIPQQHSAVPGPFGLVQPPLPQPQTSFMMSPTVAVGHQHQRPIQQQIPVSVGAQQQPSPVAFINPPRHQPQQQQQLHMPAVPTQPQPVGVAPQPAFLPPVAHKAVAACNNMNATAMPMNMMPMPMNPVVLHSQHQLLHPAATAVGPISASIDLTSSESSSTSSTPTAAQTAGRTTLSASSTTANSNKKQHHRKITSKNNSAAVTASSSTSSSSSSGSSIGGSEKSSPKNRNSNHKKGHRFEKGFIASGMHIPNLHNVRTAGQPRTPTNGGADTPQHDDDLASSVSHPCSPQAVAPVVGGSRSSSEPRASSSSSSSSSSSASSASPSSLSASTSSGTTISPVTLATTRWSELVEQDETVDEVLSSVEQLSRMNLPVKRNCAVKYLASFLKSASAPEGLWERYTSLPDGCKRKVLEYLSGDATKLKRQETRERRLKWRETLKQRQVGGNNGEKNSCSVSVEGFPSGPCSPSNKNNNLLLNNTTDPRSRSHSDAASWLHNTVASSSNTEGETAPLVVM